MLSCHDVCWRVGMLIILNWERARVRYKHVQRVIIIDEEGYS